MRRLDELAGERLGRFRLAVVEWGASEYSERSHFTLGLEGDGAPSGPIFSGIYSTGVPAKRVPGWIDGNYGGTAETDGGRVSLRELEVEDVLFELVGTAIPPNGWLALAYETLGVDTPLLRETRRLLGRGAPPVVTPVGRLLHRAGCGWNIRDWYIAEGWREGPRKLQGFKPAHEESERRRRSETAQTLREFAARAEGEAELSAAREAARDLLREIGE